MSDPPPNISLCGKPPESSLVHMVSLLLGLLAALGCRLNRESDSFKFGHGLSVGPCLVACERYILSMYRCGVSYEDAGG
jgi:hypothetical protein